MNSDQIRVLPASTLSVFALGVIIFATLAFGLLFWFGLYYQELIIMKASIAGAAMAYVSQTCAFMAEATRYSMERRYFIASSVSAVEEVSATQVMSGYAPDDDNVRRMQFIAWLALVLSAMIWTVGFFAAMAA